MARDYDITFRGQCVGSRADGSATFADQKRVTEASASGVVAQAASASSQYALPLDRRSGQPSAELLNHLADLLRQAREKGIHVVLYLPPLVPGLDARLAASAHSGEKLRRTKTVLTQWAAQQQTVLFDAGPAEQHGCIATEFIVVDFDDLVRLALEALRIDSGLTARLQARWPFILEDEAQDSSELQEKILRILTGPHPLSPLLAAEGRGGGWVRVGDPNQSINTTFTSRDAWDYTAYPHEQAVIDAIYLTKANAAAHVFISGRSAGDKLTDSLNREDVTSFGYAIDGNLFVRRRASPGDCGPGAGRSARAPPRSAGRRCCGSPGGVGSMCCGRMVSRRTMALGCSPTVQSPGGSPARGCAVRSGSRW